MSNVFLDLLKAVAEGAVLDEEQAGRAMQIMMTGGATPPQMAAFLVILRQRGERIAELTGAARVMRTKAQSFKGVPGAIDTCGTGGDCAGTYNISTAVAIVVAACGVPVIKHGNRSVSSRSGSADVLQTLEVDIMMDTRLAEQSLQQAGLCFLMAPRYHAAMRHIAPVRQDLQLRTLFNLLGPVANPASPDYQLLGVFSREWLRPMAEVLRNLGTKRAWVVHGSDGLDELTSTGISHVAEVTPEGIHEFSLHPSQAGLDCSAPDDLQGGDAEYNARAIRQMLTGQPGALRNIVLLNSAAALVIAGKANDLKSAVSLAEEAIDSGKAKETLALLSAISQSEVPDDAT